MDEKILVVNSEKDFLDMMRRTLTLAGFKVDTTENPSDALKLIKKENHKLVVADTNLSRINCIKLVKKIKAINPISNVVLLLTYNDRKDVIECIKLGLTDFFPKPISDEKLFVQTLKNCIYKISRWEDSILGNKDVAK